VTFPTGNTTGRADLYVPAGHDRHGAVLLFLGVNPAGLDDPRVVNLSEALARSGAVVMVPWSEGMTEMRLDRYEVETVVWAFQHLYDLDVVDEERVGIGGISTGASVATVAAQDERIRDRVAFVNFFGGYYKVEDLIKATVSQTRFYKGARWPWQPDSLTREVVATHLIREVPDPSERLLLTRAFLENSTLLEEVNMNDLSEEAGIVYQLLSLPSLEEADDLIDQLPRSAHETFRTLSPSTDIEKLRARMLIMHDQDDDLIPSEESRRLYDALRRHQHPDIYYTELHFFEHVDPTRQVPMHVFIREAARFYMHMYNIMRELG
jgi:hypothetical protein